MGKECNQAFVGKKAKYDSLKTTAWEAKIVARAFFLFLDLYIII